MQLIIWKLRLSFDYNQSDFGVDHLVMSMCRVFSCVVGRCLSWPVCSLGKTLLAFALLHFVVQGQICLFLQVSLDFLLLHSSALWWKGHLFWGLVLEGLGRSGQYNVALRYNLREELCSHTNKEEEAVRAIWYQKIAEVGTFLFITPDEFCPRFNSRR